MLMLLRGITVLLLCIGATFGVLSGRAKLSEQTQNREGYIAMLLLVSAFFCFFLQSFAKMQVVAALIVCAVGLVISVFGAWLVLEGIHGAITLFKNDS